MEEKLFDLNQWLETEIAIKTVKLNEMIRTTEQSEFFEMLQISLRRLEIFAYTALQIAELQTLQNQMPKNPEKLTEVLDELRKLIRNEEYQVTLKVELGNPNMVIMINRPFFITALTKILENALRYSPSNGEIVMIVNREDAGVRFIIRDQGPGFAPGVLLKKFEPFVAGTPHIDKNPALSLSMVKFIIEGHGGVIDMYNTEQGGATIDFTIP